jgi:type II secretory pathway pseudopilin PulG
MTRRLREEGGFTLMEVLVAATVGFVVIAATLGLLESTVRLNTGVMAKTDAMQRGRIAMDTLTQQLRSQVCLDWNHSAILEGATENTVTFYGDFSADGKKPVKRQIVFDQAKHEIRSLSYTTTSTATPPPWDSYSSSASGTQTILENAWVQYDDVKKQDVPFLKYYAYQTTDGVLRADQELAPPLDAAKAARVARVDIAFLARPTGAKDSKRAVNISDQVMARHADPNKSIPDPNCI